MDRERRTERSAPEQEASSAQAPHPEWRRDHWHRNRATPAAAWGDEAVVIEPCLNPHRHKPWWQQSLPFATNKPEPDGFTTEWGTTARPFPSEVVGG